MSANLPQDTTKTGLLQSWRQRLVDPATNWGIAIASIVATVAMSTSVNIVTGMLDADVAALEMALRLCAAASLLLSGAALLLTVSVVDGIRP